MKQSTDKNNIYKFTGYKINNNTDSIATIRKIKLLHLISSHVLMSNI